jgi:hypothetical protein
MMILAFPDNVSGQHVKRREKRPSSRAVRNQPSAFREHAAATVITAPFFPAPVSGFFRPRIKLWRYQAENFSRYEYVFHQRFIFSIELRHYFPFHAGSYTAVTIILMV